MTTLNDALPSSTEKVVINRILLLQSLNRNQNPNNNIDLEDLDAALASNALSFSEPELLQRRYSHFVNNNGYFQTQRNTFNHRLETLRQTIAVELPRKESIDADGDGLFDQMIELSCKQNEAID